VPSAAVVLQARNLVVQYPATRALDHLSLTINGGVTAIVGPNGAGKTTLIEIAEGLRTPDEGTIEVLGVDPRAANRDDRSRVGVMLQTGGIASGARASEHIRHIARMYRNALDADALCARLGLTALDRTPYRRMSGGQRQLLALAAAVVGRPQLVFLDEPTAGLDPAARVRTWELIAEMRSAGAHVIVTTHYLEEAEALADDVVLIHRGRVIAQGAPDALRASHTAPGVRISASAIMSDQQLRETLTHDLSLTIQTTAHVAVSGDSLVVTGADPSVLRRAVVQWFARHDVNLESMSDVSPDLEELFFELTSGEPE
jgi:ABC-2 type transport system ATP-binding protein